MCHAAFLLALAAVSYAAYAELRYRRQVADWRERQWNVRLRAHRDRSMGRIREYSRPGYQWRTKPKAEVANLKERIDSLPNTKNLIVRSYPFPNPKETP